MKDISKKRMRSRGKKQSQGKNSRGCKLCGKISIGRGIVWHIEKTHQMDYPSYCKTFQNFIMIIPDASGG